MSAGPRLHAFVAATVLTGCPDPPEATYEVSLEVDDSRGAFLSVWGTGRDDVIAVGGQPLPDGGIAYHFDGAEWSELELPPGTPLLNWVHGVDGVLFAVGNEGAFLRSEDGGQSWTRSSAGTTDPLWGVWGPAANDLWAVGGDAFSDADPIIVHYDGTTWTMHDLPALDRSPRALFKVWGPAADDVVAVGDAGVVLEWNGVEWKQVLVGTGEDLIALWGDGEEILAVGGRSNGVLARRKDGAWSSEVPGALAGLNGVWMDEGGDATVVGIVGTLADVPAGSFAFESAPSAAGALTLHAVWGTDDGARFAAGGSLAESPPWRGIVVARLP